MPLPAPKNNNTSSRDSTLGQGIFLQRVLSTLKTHKKTVNSNSVEALKYCPLRPPQSSRPLRPPLLEQSGRSDGRDNPGALDLLSSPFRGLLKLSLASLQYLPD